MRPHAPINDPRCYRWFGRDENGNTKRCGHLLSEHAVLYKHPHCPEDRPGGRKTFKPKPVFRKRVGLSLSVGQASLLNMLVTRLLVGGDVRVLLGHKDFGKLAKIVQSTSYRASKL